jgi:hypothetical protein
LLDDEEFAAKARPANILTKEIRIHCEAIALVDDDNGGSIELYNLNERRIYSVDLDGSVTIFGCASDTGLSDDLIRIIRGYSEVKMLSEGAHVKVHMGGVAIDDVGIGFCAPKGGGKTTILSRTLQTMAGARFCSNDKSYLCATPTHTHLIGEAQRIGVREGTIRGFKEFEGSQPQIIEDKSFFWMDEFASLFGRDTVPEFLLSMVVVPQFKLGGSSPVVRVLDAETVEQLLEEQVFEFSDRVTPYWLFDLLLPTWREAKRSHLSLLRPNLLSVPWLSISGDFYHDEFRRVLVGAMRSAGRPALSGV